jgi:PEP-CTERM motif
MSVRILARQTRFASLLAVVAGCVLIRSADGATLSLNTAAPSGNIMASQLTDLGPGAFDGGRNYSDNGGPPGQTFTVSAAGLANRITIKGRGDSAGGYNNGPLPMTGAETWGIQIAAVNGDGSLTSLASETATGFSAAANISDYLTFNLSTPVALSTGQTYAFSAYISQGSWFGWAHSDADVYADGVAINNNSSTANPGGNAGGPRYTFVGNGFAAPVPAVAGQNAPYDYAFAVQGVPEPASILVLMIGAFGLATCARRR